MAGCKSHVRAMQRRPVSVPTCMQEGEKFIRWDEDSLTGTAVTMRVDPHGYFLHIVDQNKEVELLDILTIRDTRTGCYAKTPKDQKLRDMVTMGGGSSSLEDKTVTLCYGSDFVNVNFINFCCNKQETAKLWCDELLKMAYNLLSIHSCVTSVLQKTHTRICLDVDKTGKIPVKNVIKTFASHKDDRKRVEKALEACGLPSTKAHVIEPERFSFKHFLSFYTHLTGRQEIEKIFDELCGSDDAKKKGYLTVQQLVYFLNQMQRDPRLNEILYPYADAQKAREIIAQYEPNKANISKGMLSSEGFMQYLMSDDNGIVPLDKLDLSDDMEQPLSHYFINSSHNTYLTGHQFTGKSSVEIYRQCLLSGCRCVELDFWNGRTEEPVICHGFTLVPEILAKDVISAIAESAFKTSEWPVILSFENHCNQKQQAKIAQYCQEMFGDMLLESPLPNFPLEANQSLPPPAALRRKILIKNKKKHHHKHHHKTPVTRQPTFAVPVQPELSVSEEAGSADPQAAAGDSDDEDSSSEEEDSTACDLTPEELERLRDRSDKEQGTAGRESQAGEEISALVNYVQPGHFHSFQEAERRNRSYEMSSFVETQATTLLKAFPVEFVNYNKRQLSRVYPKGTRVDSHNFMPQVFWNAGCQLVALNYQTLDLAMQLNVGIFEYNGRSGYLLKPDFMRRPDRRFDPFAESTVDGIIAGTVSVKVISGQFLSEKRVGVWVEVDMYGLPADTVRRKFKTRVIQNNAINPVWDEEPFVFKKVVLPYLACVRITAYEESGRMLGHRVLPVVGLRPGYRHVSLRNEFGQVQGHGTLFIKVTVGDYVPFGLSDFAEALVNPIKYQSELEKRAQQLRVLTDDETDDAEGVDAESVVAAAAAAVDSNSALGHITSSTSTPRRDLASTSSVDLQRPRVTSGLPTVSTAGSFPSPATRRAANSYSTGAAGGACVTAASELSANGDVSAHTTSLDTPSHKRTDTLRNTSATATSSEDINIPSELSVADSVEMLWEDRQVRDRRQELERKLETLQKKFNKDRLRLLETGCSTSLSGERRSTLSKTHHRLVKTFSHKAMENSDTTVVPCAEAMELLYSQWAAAERELKEKYIDVIYDTLDKTVRSSQALQLKKLQLFHDRKVAESKKKIENDLKESSKKLVKKNLSKDEMSRLRREMSQVIVKDGVEHREKLTGRYNQALESLTQQHLQVRQLCNERRESARHRLSMEESARVSELLKNNV